MTGPYSCHQPGGSHTIVVTNYMLANLVSIPGGLQLFGDSVKEPLKDGSRKQCESPCCLKALRGHLMAGQECTRTGLDAFRLFKLFKKFFPHMEPKSTCLQSWLHPLEIHRQTKYYSAKSAVLNPGGTFFKK